MVEDGMIAILETDGTIGTQTLGIDRRKGEKGALRNSIDVCNLSEQLKMFSKSLNKVFCGIETNYNQYELDEIEIKADISTSAGISIIGSAEITSTGGITLKFKRKRNIEKR